jgi:outer membrane protein W
MRVIGIAVLLMLCTPASADNFYFVGGVTYVNPRLEAQKLDVSSSGLATLAGINLPTLADSGVEVDPATIPGGIIGYTLPWLDRRLSIEAPIAMPVTMKLKATGKLANESLAPMVFGIPTGIPPLGPELGEANAIPPIITAVYRFARLGPVSPYVGGGPTMLFITNAKITNPVLLAAGTPTFTLDDAYGLILQTGFELHLWSRVFARFDLKYGIFSTVHSTISNIKVKTTIPFVDTVDVGSVDVDVAFSPIIIQAGVGARF